ncbi:MAG: carbamoyltransferase [Planctomycetes bacterium]|nr:carbamoyltransferase [Planctomycetota bacterium]
MTAILGISAYYHDSAAALMVDGQIVAAAQEERFTRKKHDANFPANAVAFCLRHAGLRMSDLDLAGFYEKPLVKFERLLETYLAFAPAGFGSFVKAMPVWIREKLFMRGNLRKQLKGYRRRIIFPEHHEAHAASAFFPSPFEEAAILTLDGVGEYATASFGHGRGNKITLTHELRFPHSVGLLYSAFTYFCGFRVNSGEYKLMGLAPYGRPVYAKQILDEIVDLKDDGSIRLNLSYFNYCTGLTMTSRKFDRLFGGPARKAESRLTQREMDIAASIQQVTEEIMLKAARHVHAQTGLKNLCLAGGVALNCVANGRLLREGPFGRIWVQPAAGDAGGALGTAMFIWHQLLDKPRQPQPTDSQYGSLLGPAFDERDIRRFLDEKGAKYRFFEDEQALCDHVADQMAGEKVVGWVSGRMEFGPRALGGRSIIGDARSTKMQSVMNLKIKFRESFRPFAPSCLEERVSDYFEMKPADAGPYMLLVAPVRQNRRKDVAAQLEKLEGIDKLAVIRSDVPAITHVDFSARVQTVDEKRHGRYYRLVKAFEKKTGCPVIINTSFNIRGEPIVCSPQDAYRCFLATNMDVLVLERFVLAREDQPQAKKIEVDEYLAKFELD